MRNDEFQEERSKTPPKKIVMLIPISLQTHHVKLGLKYQRV